MCVCACVSFGYSFQHFHLRSLSKRQLSRMSKRLAAKYLAYQLPDAELVKKIEETDWRARKLMKKEAQEMKRVKKKKKEEQLDHKKSTKLTQQYAFFQYSLSRISRANCCWTSGEGSWGMIHGI